MKEGLRDYFRFSRTERWGVIALSGLLVGLIVYRAAVHRWAKPDFDAAKEKEFSVAWDVYKRDYAKPAAGGRYAQAEEGPAPPVELFAFDPNSLDSAGFRRLGLSARATKGLMNWRRKGKVFYRPEDLEPLYNLPPETYASIKPYIRISAVRGSGNRYGNSNGFGGWRNDPLPAVIDLNTTDAAMLVRLNGIGQTLADKIIARRTALGGFVKHEQLLEVYRFPDTTYAMLKEKLRIRPEVVRRLNINTATEAQLAAHPYIGAKVAPNIILLRDGLKGYKSVDDLKQVPLMTADLFRKIAPYCVVQ